MKILRFLPIFLIFFISGCQQAIDNGNASTTNQKSRRIVVVGAKPFPTTTSSFNIVKPSNRTQAQLNQDVKDFYAHWKTKYVKPSNGNTPGGFYLEADSTGEPPAGWGNVKAKTQSEAHGYGMVISALMDDKALFDGLYAMYNDYRSIGNGELMSWIIPANEDHSLAKSNSASDGDLDIAYGLLLAHDQWSYQAGSKYFDQALKVIAAIKESDFHATSKRIQRGDWDDSQYDTRPSDWMVSHFRTFYNVTKDDFWIRAIDEIYTMIDEVIATDSPVTNLLPDFVEGDPATKAKPPFLEGPTDDDYSWNACRYPWRIAMDYGQFGTIKSKNALDGLVAWATAKCNNDPWEYMAGYTLDGEVLKEDGVTIDYSSNAFYSPLAVAATHNVKNQTYINNAWAKMAKPRDWNSYFGDNINMQCLIYISGNWWLPEVQVVDTEAPSTPTGLKGVFAPNNTVTVTWNESTDNIDSDLEYAVANDTFQISHWVYSGTSMNIDMNEASDPFGDLIISIRAVDDNYNFSDHSSKITIVNPNSASGAGDVPSDPNATSKPSKFQLSKNTWNGSSTYKIIGNMWWGNNATVVKLYENGVLIDTVKPAFSTPSAQKVQFSFNSKPKGTYVYKVDAINQHGTTTSNNFTYYVTR